VYARAAESCSQINGLEAGRAHSGNGRLLRCASFEPSDANVRELWRAGRVKRERHRDDAGEFNPRDILGRFEALCDCYSGSGEVPLDPKAIHEK
jgi:hypothetical protein